MKDGSIGYSREPNLISLLRPSIAHIIGSESVYISDFVIAKIKGFIPNVGYHPEISDAILNTISYNLNYPEKILEDTRAISKYLFICSSPLHEIVVEVNRQTSDKTEINTIHLINTRELKRLERKFPVVYSSSAETPCPPMHSDSYS